MTHLLRRAARRATLAVGCLLSACTSLSSESRPASRPHDADLPIAVVGNAAVTTAELLATAKPELESFQTLGRRLTDLDDAAFAMERALRNVGRAHAVVTFVAEPDQDNPTSVVFKVSEGPLATFEGVSFEGQRIWPAERLAKFFDFRTKDQKPGDPVPFLEQQMQAGVSGVEDFYLGEGFHRVSVGPPRVTWDSTGTRAHVVVSIDEGRAYVVRRVDLKIAGAQTAREALAVRAKAFEGKPYSLQIAAEATSAIRDELGREGRLFMEVAAESVVDDDKAEAVVTLRVRPGPTVRINAVGVSGEDRTAVGFIIEESLLEPGALLTQQALEDAIDRLYGTGLFKSVAITKRRAEFTGDVAPTDLEIDVEEVAARTVDFEVGYGSYEQLRGAVRYRDRNFLGRGRVLEIAPTASLKGYGAEMKFFDNYIFGRENTLEINTRYAARREPSFDATTLQAELAVRHRFDRLLSARAGYRLRRSDATDVFVNIPSDLVNTAGFSSGPFAEVEYDSRDNAFNPQRGVLLGSGAAWSTPTLGADFDYLELHVNAATFVAFGPDTVLALGMRGNNREILNGAANLPIQERYFLGGDNSVRSFYQSELGPVDGNGRPVGGLFSLEGSVELRQCLVGDLYGAVFYDVGTVGRTSFDVGGPYGHAIGAGLRYLLPFGPVRLDFAYNPGPRFAADSDWAVHFSFGFSF